MARAGAFRRRPGHPQKKEKQMLYKSPEAWESVRLPTMNTYITTTLPSLGHLARDLHDAANAAHAAAVINLAQAEKDLDAARAHIAAGGHYDANPLSGVNLAARRQTRALLALDDAQAAVTAAARLRQVAG